MLLRSFPSSPLTPIHTTFRIVKQHSRDQKGEDIPKGTWEYFPAQWEIICLIPYMDLPHDALKGNQMAFIKQDGMRGWVDRKWIENHTDELEDNQILLDHLAKEGGGIRFSSRLLDIDEDKLSKGVLKFWKMFWDNHWQPIPTPYEEIDWARHCVRRDDDRNIDLCAESFFNESDITKTCRYCGHPCVTDKRGQPVEARCEACGYAHGETVHAHPQIVTEETSEFNLGEEWQ